MPNKMSTQEVLMHIAAGLEYGEESTCGKKVRYSTEASAVRAATAMSIKTEEAIEAYPCAFCDRWHVGRALTEEERGRFV